MTTTAEVFAQVVSARRSVRAFLPKPVPQAVLDEVFTLAGTSPSNCNCQPWITPVVSGAAIGFDGQIAVYDTRDASQPCYACVFAPEAGFEEAHCASMGVFAPLVGIVGSMQAADALKLLAGVGSPLAGRLQMLDARSMAWSEISVPRNPDCPVCAARPG